MIVARDVRSKGTGLRSGQGLRKCRRPARRTNRTLAINPDFLNAETRLANESMLEGGWMLGFVFG